MTTPTSPPNAFTLAGADSAFGSRTKDVFGSLGTIEAKHAAFSSTRAGRDLDLIKPDPIDEDLGQVGGPIQVGKRGDGVEREFKVPMSREAPQRSRGGFTRRARELTREPCMNPEKWKRYDLSEVTSGQLSERSNQTAALDFLQSVRHASEAEQGVEPEGREPMEADGSLETSRHVFHRPASQKSGEGIKRAKAGMSAEKFSAEKFSAEKSFAEKSFAEKLSAEKSSAEKSSPRKLPVASFVTAEWVKEEEDNLVAAESTSVSNTSTLPSSCGLASDQSDLTGGSKVTADSKSTDNEPSIAGKDGVTFKAVAASRRIRKRGDTDELEKEDEEEEEVEIRRAKHLKSREKFSVATSTALTTRATDWRDKSDALGGKDKSSNEEVANEFEEDWGEVGEDTPNDDEREEGPSENSEAFSF